MPRQTMFRKGPMDLAAMRQSCEDEAEPLNLFVTIWPVTEALLARF